MTFRCLSSQHYAFISLEAFVSLLKKSDMEKYMSSSYGNAEIIDDVKFPAEVGDTLLNGYNRDVL